MSVLSTIMRCYEEGNFILHSGEKTDYFFDVMKLIDDAEFAEYFMKFVEKDEFLVGIEFGGAILAAASCRPFAVVRKDGKVYGKIPKNYTLIDDVITIGNSIQDAIKAIGYYPYLIKCIVDKRENHRLCRYIENKIESMLKVKDFG